MVLGFCHNFTPYLTGGETKPAWLPSLSSFCCTEMANTMWARCLWCGICLTDFWALEIQTDLSGLPVCQGRGNRLCVWHISACLARSRLWCLFSFPSPFAPWYGARQLLSNLFSKTVHPGINCCYARERFLLLLSFSCVLSKETS